MDCDVAVVGAGIAGSAAARALARAGLDVLLVDAAPLDRAGASWTNAVPAWMFGAAGVDEPRAPEACERRSFVFLSRTGARTRVEPAPYLHVRMPGLQGRLRDDAVAAGARVLAPARVHEARLDGAGRPVALAVRAGEGGRARTLTLRARLFVDAGGIEGAVRGLVPALADAAPRLPPGSRCTAAQETCEVADQDAAAAFLARHGMKAGEAFGWFGMRGGYSTILVETDPDLRHVGVLAGVVADGRNGTGPGLLREVKSENPWIGRGVSGGAGTIPLRRPYASPVAPGVALIGDAACQVLSAHGSGVGMAMLAARTLAGAVAGAHDPGAIDVLWRYASPFQRTHGGMLAAYAAFRRMSQGLSGDDSDALVACGLMGEHAARQGMEQRPPIPSLADALGAVRAATRRPDLVARVAAAGARMAAAIALYATYPASPDPAAMRRWAAADRALLGDA